METILCNKCGKKSATKDYAEANRFTTQKCIWGYGSKYDMEIHTFTLCEKCYIKFIRTFKIKHHIAEYDLSGE